MQSRDTRKVTLSYSSNRRAGRLARVVERLIPEPGAAGSPRFPVVPLPPHVPGPAGSMHALAH